MSPLLLVYCEGTCRTRVPGLLGHSDGPTQSSTLFLCLLGHSDGPTLCSTLVLCLLRHSDGRTQCSRLVFVYWGMATDRRTPRCFCVYWGMATDRRTAPRCFCVCWGIATDRRTAPRCLTSGGCRGILRGACRLAITSVLVGAVFPLPHTPCPRAVTFPSPHRVFIHPVSLSLVQHLLCYAVVAYVPWKLGRTVFSVRWERNSYVGM